MVALLLPLLLLLRLLRVLLLVFLHGRIGHQLLESQELAFFVGISLGLQ